MSDFFIKGPNGAVVLFEGCGGSTAGLHAAGYATVGFEYWQPAVTCAQANGFDARLHDLSDPTLDHLVPYAPLWWASPPCQPFSAAGTGDGEFDDRDGFPWLLRLVALRLPDVLIVENVKGLTFRKHSAYFCAVLEGLKALGYEVDWRVLCAADYGVPQTRERCIIIARRDGGPITWPMPTHCETGGMFTAPWVTMAQALGWGLTDGPCPTIASGHLDAQGIGGSGARARLAERYAKSGINLSPAERPVRITDVSSGGVSDETEQIVQQLGGDCIGLDGDGERVSGHSHHMHQPANGVKPQFHLHYRQVCHIPGPQYGQPIICDVTDRPASTVGTNSGGQWVIEQSWPFSRPATTIAGDDRVFQPGGHHEPGEQSQNAIRVTIPELAALQGFPSTWTWTGTKTQQAKMIGNAVPPALAQAVASVNRPALERAA